jgi:formylglycine-generating enzyme required for sulfatase activity
MEFVEGGNLRQLLEKGPLPPRQAALLTTQLAQAVQAMHTAGVVHRDIKPANVLLTLDGSPRLADFGLARRLGENRNLTRSGQVLGTPSYMAPEQAAGRSAEAGPAVDVYALGAVLYEMLTGCPPFQGGSDAQTLAQLLSQEPVAPHLLAPAVPLDLETVCLKCLEKDPARRYPDCRTLGDDLRRWLDGKPVSARRPGPRERLVRWTRRSPTVACLVAVTVMAALGLGVVSGVAVWQWRTASLALRAESEAREQKDRERSRRALAQVDALLRANPRLVPPILKDLAEQRSGGATSASDDEVLPRLQQVWGEPDVSGNRQRRMRAALALLPVEPALVRDALAGWLLEVPDPAELLLVRDALKPHSAALRDRLWQALARPGTTPPERLRILAALAAFDPEGAGWNRAAAQAVAPWLSDNPLYLGPWTEAFRPVRRHLRGPLTAVFSGQQLKERRGVAAGILADYAGDEPGTLADLVVRADALQFAALLPALGRQRERALPLLRQELERRAEPTWDDQPLDPSWPVPAATVRQEIEQAGGILAERFALVQTLPLERFAALAGALKPGGYRPVRFRPYRAGQHLRAAALWQRDGRRWESVQGVSAVEVRRLDAALQKRGYRPVEVCGWLPPGESTRERFAALWVRAADRQEVRLYVGVHEHKHESDGWTRLREAGLDPMTFQAFLAADGTRRLSSVWARFSPSRQGGVQFWDYQPDYEAKLRPDQVQMDVAVRPARAGQTPLELARAELHRRERDVKNDPDNLLWRYWRGATLSRLGEDKRALKDLDAYLKVEKRYSMPFAERALVLARLGRAEQAQEDLRQFQRMVGSTTLPVEALVAFYLGREVPWLALDELIEKEPNNADVLLGVAVLHTEAARLRHLAAGAALVGGGDPLWAVAASTIASRRSDEYRRRAVGLLRRFVEAAPSRWQEVRDDLRLAPLHDHAGYQALLASFHLQREYSGVWHVIAAGESVELHGLAPLVHLEQCRRLTAQGWRPVGISAAEIIPGQPVVTASVWQRPRLSESAREALAQRQAGAALALARLGETERVWPLLAHGPYPEARSRLIHLLGPDGVPAGTVAARLRTEQDVSIRRALILALGEYRTEQIPTQMQQRLVGKLLDWYRDDADCGIHGAIDWLLRHGKEGPNERPLNWGQATALDQIDEQLKRRGPDGKRHWYVNGQGQTLTVIDSHQPFLMSSPGNEAGQRPDEKLHWRRIGRRYALATKPVTVAQWQRFLKAHPEVKHSYNRQHSPEADGPIVNLTWYEAAQYCRWLSEQEGFAESEMVYPSVAEIQKGKDGKTPVRLPADYLKRKGYRLPTEAEWEFACRAGSRTSRYFGSSLELLPRYAWYIGNAKDRTWPVGQKKPNDLGLFDMHGNAWTWCEGSGWEYRTGSLARPAPDEEDRREITDSASGVIRGTSFDHHPWLARSAARSYLRPTHLNLSVGIRVARTCD